MTLTDMLRYILEKLKADEPWTWTDFVFYSVTTFLYLIANEVIYSTNLN